MVPVSSQQPTTTQQWPSACPTPNGQPVERANPGIPLTDAMSEHGGVGNPQIRTDHPLYPGELACSTPARLAETILATDWGLGLGDSPRDAALKLWLWRITHTIHDYSPRIWTPIHEINRRTQDRKSVV